MPAAIAGDGIGSVYEHRAVKHTEFPLFARHSTFIDDTVPTVAVAHAILNGIAKMPLAREFRWEAMPIPSAPSPAASAGAIKIKPPDLRMVIDYPVAARLCGRIGPAFKELSILPGSPSGLKARFRDGSTTAS